MLNLSFIISKNHKLKRNEKKEKEILISIQGISSSFTSLLKKSENLHAFMRFVLFFCLAYFLIKAIFEETFCFRIWTTKQNFPRKALWIHVVLGHIYHKNDRAYSMVNGSAMVIAMALKLSGMIWERLRYIFLASRKFFRFLLSCSCKTKCFKSENFCFSNTEHCGYP